MEQKSPNFLQEAAKNNPNIRKMIGAASVRELCGGISDMSLWRWLNDPALAFPRPVYIQKRRFWREADIFAWLDARAEGSRGAA